MEKCSISAERSFVSLNMTWSIFDKFDYDLLSMLKKFNIFISDAC